MSEAAAGQANLVTHITSRLPVYIYSYNYTCAADGGSCCVPNLGNPVFTPQPTLIQKATTMVKSPG